MKIGVLAGTFDPIHTGHIEFIKKTAVAKKLDEVFLLVEKTPRHKPVFAGYDERVSMIKLATRNHPYIKIYHSSTDSYPISSCLPEIKKIYQPAEYYLLLGYDVLAHIKKWKDVDELLKGVEIIVAQREDGITSGNIRSSLAKGQKPLGLEPRVGEYIKRKGLYGKETMSGA